MNEEDRGAFTAFLKTAIRAGVIFDFNDPDFFRDNKKIHIFTVDKDHCRML